MADVAAGSTPSRPATTERRSLVGYLSAYTVSMLGDRFAELALPLVVLATTHDPAAAGAVGASIQAPSLLLALWLGGRVDRHSRRTLMLCADVVRAACFVVFTWLAASHLPAVWPYLLVGPVVGCGNMLFGIAGSAILPEIVGGRRLVQANALTEAGDALTTVTGPALAGAVVGRFSAAVALAADAVTFALSALFLLAVRPPARRTASETPAAGLPAAESLTRDPHAAELSAAELSAAELSAAEATRPVRWLAGPLRAVFRDPVQRVVQVALTTLSAHGAGVVLAIIVLASSTLRVSTFGLGLVLGAAGVGGLLASLVATKWPAPFGTVRGIGLTMWLSAGFMVGLAVAPRFWWALAANGLLDGAITAAFIATASVRQQHTPRQLLGRVTAASTVCNGAARVVGAGGVGLLLRSFGPRTALVVDAVLLGLAALYVTTRASAGGRRTR
jgi:MFS family permease